MLNDGQFLDITPQGYTFTIRELSYLRRWAGMSIDLNLLCDHHQVYHHMGQTGGDFGFIFGYSSKDDAGRIELCKFIEDHIHCLYKDQKQLRVVRTDDIPKGYKECVNTYRPTKPVFIAAYMDKGEKIDGCFDGSSQNLDDLFNRARPGTDWSSVLGTPVIIRSYKDEVDVLYTWDQETDNWKLKSPVVQPPPPSPTPSSSI